MTDHVYEEQLKALGIKSSEEEVKISVKTDEIDAMRSVVRSIMDSIQGRRWIYGKLNACGVFTAPIVPNDSYGTHVLCGIQSVGHMILSDVMAASPDNFPLMLKEAAV